MRQSLKSRMSTNSLQDVAREIIQLASPGKASRAAERRMVGEGLKTLLVPGSSKDLGDF